MKLNLKQIRESKGISQKELASALGVTESAVSHWESNRYLPAAENLHLAAKALGVTIDELVAEPEGEDADDRTS